MDDNGNYIGGEMSRYYTISQNSLFGGTQCEASNGQIERSNCPITNEHCSNIDCEVNWSSWTPCATDSSHDCSDDKIGAETTRQFNSTVSAQYGGIACPSKQTSNCPITNAHCADINCEVNWGSWTPCATDSSHDCSDGKMGAETTQSYTITTSNQFGGAACPPTRTSNCPATTQHCLRSTPTPTPASTPVPTTPTPTTPGAPISIPNSTTVTFSINNSQGTPNRFGTSFNHTTDINAGSPTFKRGSFINKEFVCFRYSRMQSGVERNVCCVRYKRKLYSQYV